MATVIPWIRLGGVWRLVGSNYTPPTVPTDAGPLVTEDGDFLITEAGDNIYG